MTAFYMRARASGMQISQTFHPPRLHMVSLGIEIVSPKDDFQMSNDEIRAIIDRDEKCICG